MLLKAFHQHVIIWHQRPITLIELGFQMLQVFPEVNCLFSSGNYVTYFSMTKVSVPGFGGNELLCGKTLDCVKNSTIHGRTMK